MPFGRRRNRGPSRQRILEELHKNSAKKYGGYHKIPRSEMHAIHKKANAEYSKARAAYDAERRAKYKAKPSSNASTSNDTSPAIQRLKESLSKKKTTTLDEVIDKINQPAPKISGPVSFTHGAQTVSVPSFLSTFTDDQVKGKQAGDTFKTPNKFYDWWNEQVKFAPELKQHDSYVKKHGVNAFIAGAKGYSGDVHKAYKTADFEQMTPAEKVAKLTTTVEGKGKIGEFEHKENDPGLSELVGDTTIGYKEEPNKSPVLDLLGELYTQTPPLTYGTSAKEYISENFGSKINDVVKQLDPEQKAELGENPAQELTNRIANWSESQISGSGSDNQVFQYNPEIKELGGFGSFLKTALPVAAVALGGLAAAGAFSGTAGAAAGGAAAGSAGAGAAGAAAGAGIPAGTFGAPGLFSAGSVAAGGGAAIGGATIPGGIAGAVKAASTLSGTAGAAGGSAGAAASSGASGGTAATGGIPQGTFTPETLFDAGSVAKGGGTAINNAAGIPGGITGAVDAGKAAVSNLPTTNPPPSEPTAPPSETVPTTEPAEVATTEPATKPSADIPKPKTPPTGGGPGGGGGSSGATTTTPSGNLPPGTHEAANASTSTTTPSVPGTSGDGLFDAGIVEQGGGTAIDNTLGPSVGDLIAPNNPTTGIADAVKSGGTAIDNNVSKDIFDSITDLPTSVPKADGGDMGLLDTIKDIGSTVGDVTNAVSPIMQLIGGIKSSDEMGDYADLLKNLSKEADPWDPYREPFAQAASATLNPNYDITSIPGLKSSMDYANKAVQRKFASKGLNESGNVGYAMHETISKLGFDAYMNWQRQTAELGGAKITPQQRVEVGAQAGLAEANKLNSLFYPFGLNSL